MSNQVVLLQLQSTPIPLNIIQVYAPTYNETELFYDQIKPCLTKPFEIIIIMGDMNAKVGKGIYVFSGVGCNILDRVPKPLLDCNIVNPIPYISI